MMESQDGPKPTPPEQTPESGGDEATRRASEEQSPTALLDRPPPRRLPAFKVLLHNDDVNSDVHVIRSLVELTPLDTEGAVLVTKEAQETGLALVLVTHRERAELYQEQLASKSLTVTLEPV